MRLENNRAGKLIRMQSDYECFVPNNLQDIDINIDAKNINELIKKAYLLLGRLDGMAILADIDLFVSMYVQKRGCNKFSN